MYYFSMFCILIMISMLKSLSIQYVIVLLLWRLSVKSKFSEPAEFYRFPEHEFRLILHSDTVQFHFSFSVTHLRFVNSETRVLKCIKKIKCMINWHVITSASTTQGVFLRKKNYIYIFDIIKPEHLVKKVKVSSLLIYVFSPNEIIS